MMMPGIIEADQTTICYNTIPDIRTVTGASGGAPPYSYRWEIRATDATYWTTSSHIFPLTKSAYIRRAVIDYDDYIVYTDSILITVVPEVTVHTVTDKVGCINTVIPETTFSSPTAGATFSWTNSNTAIGLPASGTGSQPQFTAAQTGTATITVTPSYNGCTGTARTYTITISSCLVPVNPHLRTRVTGNL